MNAFLIRIYNLFYIPFDKKKTQENKLAIHENILVLVFSIVKYIMSFIAVNCYLQIVY